ncbi:unnamed protein product [Gordionus sp. m RMFG-2023]
MKGVGAVLSHTEKDGSENPIGFASRTLSMAEKNYSTIEREALGLVFGVKKFYEYSVGQTFTIWTDHKPLVYIFGNKSSANITSPRLLKWSLMLGGYNCEIKYKAGKENKVADELPRCPMEDNTKDHNEEVYFINEYPISADEIRKN